VVTAPGAPASKPSAAPAVNTPPTTAATATRTTAH
jgi:hypothetical protein